MRLMTAPLGPSGGSVRPFSSSVTPPALPSVRTNGRFDTHSRVSPAGIVSSVVRPSSVRTRIHVASDTRATSRYGEETPPVAACTFGSHGGAGVAGGGSAPAPGLASAEDGVDDDDGAGKDDTGGDGRAAGGDTGLTVGRASGT